MNETTLVQLIWNILWAFDKQLDKTLSTICGHEATITEDIDGFISKTPIEVKCKLIKGHLEPYHSNGLSRWINHDNEVLKGLI